MRQFLRNIAVFFLILIGIAVMLEIIGESIPNSYTYKRVYMEQHAPQIQTLFLGSSNVYDACAASEVPNAFNLANSSQTVEDDYRLLARYIDDMDSLQTVVLGIGYSILAEKLVDNRRLYYTVYMGLYPRWPLSEYSFEVCNLELLAKKMLRYAVSRDVTRCDSLGQRLGHTAAAAQIRAEFWNKDVEELVENDRMDLTQKKDVITENCDYLQRIAQMCRDKGVQFVLVVMPVMPEYKAAIPQEQVRLVDSVMAAMPENVKCIDASEWAIPEDGWYNATHLTREAAVEFTRELMNGLTD